MRLYKFEKYVVRYQMPQFIRRTTMSSLLYPWYIGRRVYNGLESSAQFERRIAICMEAKPLHTPSSCLHHSLRFISWASELTQAAPTNAVKSLYTGSTGMEIRLPAVGNIWGITDFVFIQWFLSENEWRKMMSLISVATARLDQGRDSIEADRRVTVSHMPGVNDVALKNWKETTSFPSRRRKTGKLKGYFSKYVNKESDALNTHCASSALSSHNSPLGCTPTLVMTCSEILCKQCLSAPLHLGSSSQSLGIMRLVEKRTHL